MPSFHRISILSPTLPWFALTIVRTLVSGDLISRYRDSGVLTAPCGGADNSSDVDRFGEIGSHIWSTIYLTIRGGRLGVLKSGLVLAAGVAGPRNRRAGLSRRRIARERVFRRWRDGTRSVLSIYLRGAKQHERDYLCSRMKKS